MPRGGPASSPGAPRLRRIAWVTAAVLLTGVFVVRGFPYERLAAVLAAAVARNSSFTLDLRELGPTLSLRGPGIRATGLRLTAPDGAAIRLDSLSLHPAWSPRWLLLRPVFRVSADIAGGSLDGTLGTGPSFAGELAGLDLGQLPIGALWPGSSLTGSLAARADLRAGPRGPEGSVSLEARQGSATLPRAPLPLPFELLTARAALGGDALLRIDALELSGAGLEARVEGSLGPAASFAEAPCDLRVDLEAAPALRAALRGLGIRLGRDGKAALRITGTPARPAIE